MGCVNNPQYDSKGVVIIHDLPNDYDNFNFCSKATSKQFDYGTCTSNHNNNFSFSLSSDLNVQTQKTICNILPSLGLLNEINKARTNPLSFITKIQKLKKYIVMKNNKTFLYLYNNPHLSINLDQGISSFDNCIEFLMQISKQTLSRASYHCSREKEHRTP